MRADWLDSDIDELDLRVLVSIVADVSDGLVPLTLGASSSDSACSIGTVQSSSLIIDGRPVMTVRMLSKAFVEYQMRARIIRSVGERELVASRKCRPSDWAARTVRPVRFQALMRVSVEFMQAKPLACIPVNLIRGQQVHATQTEDLHLPKIAYIIEDTCVHSLHSGLSEVQHMVPPIPGPFGFDKMSMNCTNGKDELKN